LKFIILSEAKRVRMGWKARIRVDGTSIPVDIFHDVKDYNSFDKLIKSTYGQSFKGYVSYPKPNYGSKA